MASSKAKRTVFPWSSRSLALFPIHLNPVSVSCSNSGKNNLEVCSEVSSQATFEPVKDIQEEIPWNKLNLDNHCIDDAESMTR